MSFCIFAVFCFFVSVILFSVIFSFYLSSSLFIFTSSQIIVVHWRSSQFSQSHFEPLWDGRDGMGLDGMVIIGHRSSISNFGDNIRLFKSMIYTKAHLHIIGLFWGIFFYFAILPHSESLTCLERVRRVRFICSIIFSRCYIRIMYIYILFHIFHTISKR